MKLLITIFFVYLFLPGQSQNLAPNYSFEDTISCPTNQDQIYKAFPWFRPTIGLGVGTSDYFNSCSLNSSVSVPNNLFGFQMPKTGNAYAGFTLFYSDWELREYIEIPLNSNLITNKKYCIEFYVSLAEKTNLPSGGIGGINTIGAYFSQDSVLSNDWTHIPVIPQVESNFFILDTANWILISGEFIAQGGEKFITIGNFRDDANTTVMSIDTVPCGNGSSCEIYYYIEDVSVYFCDCDTTPPVAKFNYTADTLTAAFNNLSSTFSNYWFWAFGDGNTDTAYNPVHTYDSAGVYTVTLIAWHNGCSDTMVASVTVTDVGNEELRNKDSGFRIYPNPVTGKFRISNFQFPISKIEIYNLLGEAIYQSEFINPKSEIDFSSHSSGFYVLKIISNNNIQTFKIFKQ